MALILNIETCLEKALVSITHNGVALEADESSRVNDHASFLHNAIHGLMARQHFKLNELDAIGVSTGPGSYTGIRVGLAAVKGIAFALNIPLIPVSTLAIMAHAVKHSIQPDENVLICPMIDARRMEVYTALYDSHLKEILPPQNMVLETDSFNNYFQQASIVFAGSGSEKYKAFVGNGMQAKWETLPSLIPSMNSMTYTLYKQGKTTSALALNATYTKDFFQP